MGHCTERGYSIRQYSCSGPAVGKNTISLPHSLIILWRKKKLDRPCVTEIVRERDKKRFAAIEFKRKWIMPFCSPTHLASDWYWTLIAQINLQWSNRLVNINHLYLPCRNFSSVFRSRQEFLCQVWKQTVMVVTRVVYHGVTSSFFGIGILLVSDLLDFWNFGRYY